jgi:hypothetical protein
MDSQEVVNIQNENPGLENALYNFFKTVAEKHFTELGYDLSSVTEEQYMTKIEELKISFFDYFTNGGE